MSRLFSLIQNLSIDVTAGAVISSLFVCKYFNVEASWHMMLGLGIAIWLIYTIDHLRDARESKVEANNPRHSFHRRYKGLISVLAVIVFALGIVNAFQLPIRTIWFGLALGTLSGLYFVYLKFSKEQSLKELFAAVIYTCGIFTGPMSLVGQWHWSYLLVFILLFLLVAANLVLFPLYEMEMDREDNLKSIAIKRGPIHTRRLVGLLLVIHFALLLLAFYALPNDYASWYVFGAMNVILTVLLIWPDVFRRYQVYRWLGDGIFYLPLAILW